MGERHKLQKHSPTARLSTAVSNYLPWLWFITVNLSTKLIRLYDKNKLWCFVFRNNLYIRRAKSTACGYKRL